MAEVNKIPLLSLKEAYDLALRIRKGDKKARNKFIRANLRLVISIALKYLNRGLSLVDLIEEGNLGLITAAEHFKPHKSRFSTYATWWIKQAIMRALLSDVKTVRIPRHIIEIIAKWKGISTGLSQKLGRLPHPHEVAQEMDLFTKNQRFFKKTLSTGLTVTKQTSFELINGLRRGVEDKSVKSVSQQFFDKMELEKIKKLLDSISRRDAIVLRLRFGVTDKTKAPMTLAKIGKRLRLTRERVRQIERKALEKLQDLLTLIGER